MALYLGIDTSNYTTSAALYDSTDGTVISEKKLLPVKKGEAGLRQSDAVFHHTKQLPEIMMSLFDQYCQKAVFSAVGVSYRPRNIDGSYMPCFLCGEGLALSIGAMNGIPVMRTSHQIGHILAALYSAEKTDLIGQKFFAFHVSGGTTDCLLCEPDESDIMNITEIGTSLDLKAGQLIDRTGLMLDLSFPCGRELESLSDKSDKKFKVKAVLKDGSCCLSGFENKVRDMIISGESRECSARYILSAVYSTVYEMTKYAREKFGDLPVIYAGGVMSNRYIAGLLKEKLTNIYFSAPEFSCDNALGTALYAYYKTERQ